MIKKILIASLLFMGIAAVAIYFWKGRDQYEPAKWAVSATDGIHVGSVLQFTLPDQNDKAVVLNPEIEHLIMAFDKDSGGIVRGFLDEQPSTFLLERKALFVADISPIPVVIRNAFALPTLQKRDYSVALLYETAMADTLKGEKSDAITLVSLDAGVVQQVQYLTTAKELARAL